MELAGCTNAATGFMLAGAGAIACTTGGKAAAKWAIAGTAASKALPLAVALAGAITITVRVLLTFVTFVMFVVVFDTLLIVVL